MPRRRRQEKHRPATEIAAMFIGSDGLAPLFDGEPTFDSPFVARAAWQAARTAAWQHPLRGMAPPFAAIAYDGIVADLMHHNPITFGPDWSRSAIRGWYERDAASVEAFRVEHPRSALEIRDELDTYASDLRALLAIAEGVDADAWAARDPWGHYLMRRAPRSA